MKIQLTESELKRYIMEAISEANIDRTDLFKDADTDALKGYVDDNSKTLGRYRGYFNGAYPELPQVDKESFDDEIKGTRDAIDAATAELKFRKQNPSYKTPSEIRGMEQDIEDENPEMFGGLDETIERMVREAFYAHMSESKKNGRVMSIGGLEDQIKAQRKANREIEKEYKGPGFQKGSQKHKSVKDFNRKKLKNDLRKQMES